MSDSSISRYDYFIGSLKAKAHYSRDWMLRAFTIVVNDVSQPYEWALRHGESTVDVYVDGQWKVLEGAKRYEIPYVYHEQIEGGVKAGDIENLKEDVKDATWGDLIFNSRVLVYACGDIIPYQPGPLDLGDVEKIFEKRMLDDPLPGEDDVPNTLYVKHWLRFGKAIGDLAGYEVFMPSVTEVALQPPPWRDEMRKELLEQYKDQLDDPVIQAKIQTALMTRYKNEYLKGDPSEGFIYKNKSINTALKRMFVIHGPEAGFEEGGRAELITNSLQEGLDVTKYPAMVNSLRAGSYYRGALTALAGEDVDLMGRIFQNARIVKGFCGTKETYPTVIDKDYVGRYIDDGGVQTLVTAENLPQYQGKIYGMYSSMYCKLSSQDVCSICIGKQLAEYPNSLGSVVGEVPSVMMGRMMASAHAKELKTTPLDIDNFLR